MTYPTWCTEWFFRRDNHDCRPLQDYSDAPNHFGYYEIGHFPLEAFSKREFLPLYGGRAAGATIRERLAAHFQGRGNRRVKETRHKLWYRCRAFGKEELSARAARFVEGHLILAMDYEWNRRNEWKSTWELVEESECGSTR